MKNKIKSIILATVGVSLILIAVIGIKISESRKKPFQLSEKIYESIVPMEDGMIIYTESGKYYSEREKKIKEFSKTDIRKISDRYLTFIENGKMGLIDKYGNLILKAEQERIRGIQNDRYVLVENNSLFKYIDLENRNSSEKYPRLEFFKHGRAFFVKDEKIGYLDLDFKEVIPERYREANEFQNGHALVRLESETKFRYIDKQGRISSDAYDEINFQTNGIVLLKDGDKTVIRFSENSEKNSNHIDKFILEGKVIPLENSNYLVSNNGVNRVLNLDREEFSVDLEGVFLGSGDTMVFYESSEEGKNIENTKAIHSYDIETKEIRTWDIDKLNFYSGGYLVGEKNGQLDIYRKDGVKIAQGFDYALPMNFEKMIVAGSEGYGVIDLQGKEIVKLEYDGMRIIEKFNIVEKDGKFGLIHDNGKEILPPEYKNIQYILGKIFVLSDEGWRYGEFKESIK